MSTHGFDPDARHAVTREDVPYLRHGDVELLARVWRPEAPGDGRVAVVDVHGGAWCDNDRRLGKRYDAALAARGVVVVAVDFRCGATGPHPRGSVDVSSAIRWVRANADALGVDPELVVSIGSSSGGHLALLAGLCPHRFTTEANVPLADFVVALWPVSNPLARYQYATSRLKEPDSWPENFRPDRLVEGQRGYFRDEATMHDVAIQRILMANEHTHLPRALIVQPELDLNVPLFMTDTLHGALLNAGCDVTYKIYPGVGHSFAQAVPDV